ncbi:hypothetical protein [Paraburkholderia dipogonis]|uniref:hypothetical protein n=1 Tax=Paraburkholderia dipogonis TaxID=1211383 RepID=UPI0038B86DBD
MSGWATRDAVAPPISNLLLARIGGPHLVGNRGIAARHEMARHQRLDPRRRGDLADLFSAGMALHEVIEQRRRVIDGLHQLFERGQVHHFVHQYVSELGKRGVVGRVAGEDDGAVVSAGGPPDRSKLIDVMSRYGLVPAAPPPSPPPSPQ